MSSSLAQAAPSWPAPQSLARAPSGSSPTVFSLRCLTLAVLFVLSLLAQAAAAGNGLSRRGHRLFASVSLSSLSPTLLAPTLAADDGSGVGEDKSSGGDPVPPYAIALAVIGVVLVAVGGFFVARRLCAVRDGREQVQPILDTITDIGGEGHYDRDIELAAATSRSPHAASHSGGAAAYRPAVVAGGLRVGGAGSGYAQEDDGERTPEPRGMATAAAAAAAAAAGEPKGVGAGAADGDNVDTGLVSSFPPSTAYDDDEEEDDDEVVELGRPIKKTSTHYESKPRKPLPTTAASSGAHGSTSGQVDAEGGYAPM